MKAEGSVSSKQLGTIEGISLIFAAKLTCATILERTNVVEAMLTYYLIRLSTTNKFHNSIILAGWKNVASLKICLSLSPCDMEEVVS